MKIPTTVQTARISSALRRRASGPPALLSGDGIAPVIGLSARLAWGRFGASSDAPGTTRAEAPVSVGMRKGRAADLIRNARSDGEPPELLQPLAVGARQRQLGAV